MVVRARRSRDSDRVPSDVEDQIEATRPVGEVILRVVEDVISPEGAHQIGLPGAAHAGDLRSKVLGQLHGVGADAT